MSIKPYATNLFCSFCCLLYSSSFMFIPSGAAETLTLFQATESNSQYLDGLIKMALAESATHYQYNNELIPTYMARDLQLLEQGRLSVYWTTATIELEQAYRPIRIPLFRGLLGYRILLIRKGQQQKFDKMKTIDDLRDISLGQGQDWTDTRILEANGLNVVKSIKYQTLFHMLDGGRFDAFPRGLQEPWNEISAHPNLELAVEKNILIIYKMPFYLFVTKNNEKLAQDLEYGLRQIIEDGSFNEYFFNYPTIKKTLEQVNIKNRIEIKLDNPFLSTETPVDKPELWFDLHDL